MLLRWISLFVVCGALVLFIQCVTGDLIASSQLEQCIRDGSKPDDDALQCDKKFTVALTLQSGQGGTQSLKAVMKTATDSQGRNYSFSSPMTITVSRSKSYLSYPLKYKQSVNAAPYEEVISLGAFGCNDDGNSGSPSCGWTMDEAGNRIRDSQGFCCACTLMDAITDPRMRSGLNCRFGQFTNYNSAHCLRFGELWYAAYEIDPPALFFNVSIHLDWEQEDKVTKKFVKRQETLLLSPSGTVRQSVDRSVRTRLVGNFESYQSRASYDSKLFFVPSRPITNQRVLRGFKNSMLIDKILVAFQGSDCNKIGVSYSAFRYDQGNQCYGHVGSCLKYQLEDYHSSDAEKMSRSLKGDYMLENFGKFSLMAKTKLASSAASASVPQRGVSATTVERPLHQIHTLAAEGTGVEVSLWKEETTTDTSLITLTINADAIKYILNKSSGRILSVTIKDFEAFTRNGLLLAAVENTGYVIADYELTIDSCTDGVLPVLAKQVSIAAKSTVKVDFGVRVQVDATQLNSCRLRLFDLLGELLDEKVFNFTTTPIKEDGGEQGGVGSNPGRSSSGSSSGGSDSCDCFPLNVYCTIANGCNNYDMFSSIFYLLLLVIIFVFVIKFLVGRLSGGGHQKKKKKRKEKKKQRDGKNDSSAQRRHRRHRDRRRAAAADPVAAKVRSPSSKTSGNDTSDRAAKRHHHETDTQKTPVDKKRRPKAEEP